MGEKVLVSVATEARKIFMDRSLLMAGDGCLPPMRPVGMSCMIQSFGGFVQEEYFLAGLLVYSREHTIPLCWQVERVDRVEASYAKITDW
jgi:hypothetical protein